MIRMLMAVVFTLLLAMLLGLMLLLGWDLVPFLWNEHRLLSFVLASCVAAAATLMVRRRALGRDQALEAHPGPNMSAIPIAGSVGLLFAVGYVVMFWFGLPGYRPVAFGGAALGGVFGAALIWLRRRSSVKPVDPSVLHLGDTPPEDVEPAAPGPKDGPLYRVEAVARC